jgi:hypothetical protein
VVRGLVAILSVGLLIGIAGCGGSAATPRTPAKPAATPSAAVAWAASTQQLCREKVAAVTALGSVHITYGGIARVGLPAVRRTLDAYLARLLAVLREFARRQQQLQTPLAAASAMRVAREVDGESQAATSRLRTQVAAAQSPAQLSAAVQGWLATLKPLAARGDAVARQLNLPGCRSGAASVS